MASPADDWVESAIPNREAVRAMMDRAAQLRLAYQGTPSTILDLANMVLSLGFALNHERLKAIALEADHAQ